MARKDDPELVRHSIWVPDVLWRKAKSEAALRGLEISDVFVELLAGRYGGEGGASAGAGAAVAAGSGAPSRAT